MNVKPYQIGMCAGALSMALALGINIYVGAILFGAFLVAEEMARVAG